MKNFNLKKNRFCDVFKKYWCHIGENVLFIASWAVVPKQNLKNLQLTYCLLREKGASILKLVSKLFLNNDKWVEIAESTFIFGCTWFSTINISKQSYLHCSSLKKCHWYNAKFNWYNITSLIQCRNFLKCYETQ